MSLRFAMHLGISFVVLCFLEFDSAFSQELIGGDERMMITVDSIERTNSYPEKLRFRDATYRSPERGKDFVFIYITTFEKVNLNLSGGERRFSGTYLVDNNGRTHVAHSETWTSTNLEMSDSRKNGYLHFSLPIGSNPVEVMYNYQYRDESARKVQMGQVNIDLINPKNREDIELISSDSFKPILRPIVIDNGKFYQGNLLLKKNTISGIVKDFPTAYQEVKSGRSRITWGYGLGIFGVIATGSGISTLITGGTAETGETGEPGETDETMEAATAVGLGVACIAGGILLVRSGSKKFVNGVNIYTSELTSGTFLDDITINLGLAQHGFGLTFSF